MNAPESIAIRPTRAGRALLPFLASGIVAGWLFGGTSGLLGAALLVLTFVSPLFAWLHARALRIGTVRPRSASVGAYFTLPLPIRNDSLLFAARDVTLRHGTRNDGDTRPAGFLARLAPGASVELPSALHLVERGREHTLRLALSSSFPFGLFRLEASYAVPCDLLGLPRLGALRDLGHLEALEPELVPGRSTAPAGEEELFGVRDWREGESLRRVHWKLSARRDRRISREFRPHSLSDVRVLLAASFPARAAWTRRDPSFEKAVSLAATLVEHTLRQGRTVRLGVTGGPVAWTTHRGRGGLQSALVRLALVEGRTKDPWSEIRHALLEGAPAARRRTTTLAVLAGGGLGASLPRDVRVLDADDVRTDGLFQRGAPRHEAVAEANLNRSSSTVRE